MSTQRNFLTVTETAEALGISGRRVRKLLDEGRINGEKVGRDWVIYEASYQKLRPYEVKKHKTRRTKGGEKQGAKSAAELMVTKEE